MLNFTFSAATNSRYIYFGCRGFHHDKGDDGFHGIHAIIDGNVLTDAICTSMNQNVAKRAKVFTLMQLIVNIRHCCTIDGFYFSILKGNCIKVSNNDN